MPDPVPVLLDTDIGSDIDDAFALALVLASPELELRGVTTTGMAAEDRAWMVCRLLTHVGRGEVPVAYGRKPPKQGEAPGQIQYRRHPAVVWNRTVKPSQQPAIEFLHERLAAEPGKLTILALGPLTNIARLLEQHPEAAARIRRIVLMGGALEVGYNGKPPAVPEWNIRCDIPAAQTVFRSGIPLTVAPLDATVTARLNERLRGKLFDNCTALTFQLQALYQLWEQEEPVLYDPVAVALAFESPERSFCRFQDLHLIVDEKGFTRKGSEQPNARVATSLQVNEFLNWYTQRVGAWGDRTLPQPPGNVASLVERGGLPDRVHVFEDFETDIERRWWLAGKLETQDVPPAGPSAVTDNRRAMRSVITQDFDAKMGDVESSYAAVVFNPVPGPPMGSRTRLSFRYKLLGTDTLRVQLFSLSKGFHRYLSLHELPEGEWQEATVDMTQMRRADGRGEPLSEDERIDDIQFYVDPRAEVLIDDIVLYEAAGTGEERPFPERFLFTGWFDTGKQGQEWPGDFEIVPHEKPRTWDAARSVIDPSSGRARIRIHMRGLRKLDPLVRLRFRYRIDNRQTLRMALVNSATGTSYPGKSHPLEAGRWAETAVDFPLPASGQEQLVADEILMEADPGVELQVDDVLLYVPMAPGR